MCVVLYSVYDVMNFVCEVLNYMYGVPKYVYDVFNSVCDVLSW